jgi:IclR family transcriptional regulator, pca regulon regulatory protein
MRRKGLSQSSYSESTERGLAILECFSSQRPVLGLVDIADELGMSRSTTHRYVATLAALGYLKQDGNRKYRLALKVTELGMSTMNAIGLGEHAHEDLVVLSMNVRTLCTVSIAELDGPEIVYADRVESLRRGPAKLDADLRSDPRLPAFCTAMGKTLLAYLPERGQGETLDKTKLVRRGPNTITRMDELQRELDRIRENGIALEDEEYTSGVIAVAAPVRNETGEVVAAIDVSVRAATMTAEDLADAQYSHLISTADRISARLGYRWEGE